MAGAEPRNQLFGATSHNPYGPRAKTPLSGPVSSLRSWSVPLVRRHGRNNVLKCRSVLVARQSLHKDIFIYQFAERKVDPCLQLLIACILRMIDHRFLVFHVSCWCFMSVVSRELSETHWSCVIIYHYCCFCIYIVHSDRRWKGRFLKFLNVYTRYFIWTSTLINILFLVIFRSSSTYCEY